MGSELGVFRGAIITIIAFGISIFLFLKVGVIDIKMFPSSFDDSFSNFEQTSGKRELISALKESMPELAKSVLSNRDLDSSQLESLRLLYLPVVDDFVKTGDPKLIKKAQTIKILIIKGELRVFNEPK